MTSISSDSSASSSDDSSDDEKMKLLRESVDTELINDVMFKEVGSSSDQSSTNKKSFKILAEKPLPSQRNVQLEDDHVNDLIVPVTMQNYVYNKLTKIINDQIEFVDIKQLGALKPKKNSRKCARLKLLNGITLELSSAADQQSVVIQPPEIQQNKPHIKKRILSEELAVDDATKLQQSLTSLQDIELETANWTTNKKTEIKKLFKYKNKRGKLQLVEADNEFAKLRAKNNWNENQIARK